MVIASQHSTLYRLFFFYRNDVIQANIAKLIDILPCMTVCRLIPYISITVSIVNQQKKNIFSFHFDSKVKGSEKHKSIFLNGHLSENNNKL